MLRKRNEGIELGLSHKYLMEFTRHESEAKKKMNSFIHIERQVVLVIREFFVIDLWSISSTFYIIVSSFYVHRSQKHKKTDDLTVFLVLLESVHIKAAR